jgi:hypothetical protein
MTSTSCYPNSTNPSDNEVILDRKSLVYTENQTLPFLFMNPNKQIDNSRNVKHTNLFMQGHGQGSMLLDISDCNLDETTILQEIAKQYPTRIGVLTEHAGDVQVAEINFDPNDKAIDVILEKGVCFDNQSIMIPCRAIDNNVDIVYLSLHSLPFIPGKEMAEFMEETLSEYGDVLDLVFSWNQPHRHTCVQATPSSRYLPKQTPTHR